MAADRIRIRIANQNDVKRILEIYSPYITDSVITFETEVPTLEQFQLRFDEIVKNYPWLVCEIEGVIAGYAYGSAHRLRSAYIWSADAAVYIAPQFHRMNVGRSLYLKLFEILKQQGIYNVYAGITLPNQSSVGLHEALGFTKVGVYKNVGFKHSSWHDVVWYQLALSSGTTPKKIIPFPELQTKNF